MSAQTEVLASWNDCSARRAVLELVERTVSAGVPVEERVGAFDNDGTLWCEKPMPIQADFILRRLFEMAHADPELRGRQPCKAAYERDYGWLGTVLSEHYAGDDTNVRTLLAGVLAAYTGISVEAFEAKSDEFLRTAQHPTLGRAYIECAYAPMVELLAYLEDNGFSNYIVSGGGRDFMRPISQEVYGIPRDRVIGSATTFEYTRNDRGGTITHKAEADYLDDGPQKPIRIWSRTVVAVRFRPPATQTATSRCSSPRTMTTSHTSTCSSYTTTPSANSTTQTAPSTRSTGPTRGAGPSSASRTTGPLSSELALRSATCSTARTGQTPTLWLAALAVAEHLLSSLAGHLHPAKI